MAQPINLVPNGSFEDTIDYNSGSFEPTYWDLTIGTPDYFGSFFYGPFDLYKTPLNFYGYQVPKDGKAYMGLVVKNKNDIDIREYIQVKLKETLIKDSIYDVSFWVSLPDSFHLACGYKNIGFAFTEVKIDSDFEVLDYLKSYNSISKWDPMNKNEWQRIQARIKARGNEKYMIIGNFLKDDLTPVIDIGGGKRDVYHRLSYYYIDKINLSIYRDTSSVSDSISKKDIIPNVFTPNGDGINDIWQPLIGNGSYLNEIIIYNRWGNKIYSWKEVDEGWNGADFPEGVYFYKIVLKNKSITGDFLLIR